MKIKYVKLAQRRNAKGKFTSEKNIKKKSIPINGKKYNPLHDLASYRNDKLIYNISLLHSL